MQTFRAVVSVLLLLLLTSGCATTRSSDKAASSDDYPQATNDPFEPFNRAVYVFNDKVDRYVMKPVARGYRAAVPRPAQRGISNFFSNLREPAVFLNNALQGKFGYAALSLGRFITNTTVGLLGFFDVATHFGLERHDEDFGQTLAVWGVGEGPFLMLPFFGPSNIRDGVGLYADLEAYPPTHLSDERTRRTVYAVDAVDTRARLLEAGDILEQAAGEDPYVFVREAYRQRRRSLISDGAAAEPAPLDPDIFEEDEESAPAPSEPVPAPQK